LYSSERLLAECSARGMAIDAFERENPIVLHARLGAELARDDFGIDDEAILSAIRKHTVAAATMSPLDAILYLADGLEPGRDFAERAGLLDLAFRDLDAAMAATIENSLDYLRSRGLTAAPQTLAARLTYRSREKRSA
jgi:predicted HD superfamily hydrolase involved in NAD metabolism